MRHAEGCAAGVDTIRGHTFLLSGRTPIEGVWTTKKEIWRQLEQNGGRHATSSKCRFDVLVLGDLENSPVREPENSLGEKAIYVFEQRVAGRHIHVVDGNGLSRLLRGEPASCIGLDRGAIGDRLLIRSTGF